MLGPRNDEDDSCHRLVNSGVALWPETLAPEERWSRSFLSGAAGRESRWEGDDIVRIGLDLTGELVHVALPAGVLELPIIITAEVSAEISDALAPVMAGGTANMAVHVGENLDELGKRIAIIWPFRRTDSITVDVGTASRVEPRPLAIKSMGCAVIDEASGLVLQLRSTRGKRGGRHRTRRRTRFRYRKAL